MAVKLITDVPNEVIQKCIIIYLSSNDLSCFAMAGNKRFKLLAEEVMAIRASGPFGGVGGNTFDDEQDSSAGDITAIILHTGAVLDSIQVRYGNHWAPVHGGPGGPHRTKIELEPGDVIVEIKGKHTQSFYGNCIYGLEFKTSSNRKFGPYGTHERDHGVTALTTFNATPPKCMRLGYIGGQAGEYVHQLKFQWIQIRKQMLLKK